MIETIMFFAGGFLVASLLALVLIPAVHHRAIRLTERRLADAIPVSMAEFQADKDNLRAEFAMSSRRMEMSIEQLKAKATAQLAEIAKKTESINRLKTELAEKTAITDELDAKTKSLSAKMREAEQDHEAKAAAIELSERAIATKETELAATAKEMADQRAAADAQRVELAVLKTQVEQYKAQIDELQVEAKDAARRLFDERVTISAATKELEEKRQTVEVLRPQVVQLEREIAAHTGELDTRGRRIHELEALNDEHRKRLDERAGEINGLRQEIAGNKAEHGATADRLNAEKATFEKLLAAANATVTFHEERIRDLEGRLGERDRMLNQREADVSGLRREVADKTTEHAATVERLKAEKGTLETLLAAANGTVHLHAARINDLANQVAERDRLLQQRDEDASALRREIVDNRNGHESLLERMDAEKIGLEKLLANATGTVDAHAARIDDLSNWVAERDELLRQRDAEARTLHSEIAGAKGEHGAAVDRLQAEVSSLQRLLQTATHTLETRADRIDDLETWVTERDELLRQRDAEIKDLLGTEERLRADMAAVQNRLHLTSTERERAQAELAALRREAEETWMAERDDAVQLRKRINDFAAQVAQMVMTAEKTGPIDTILKDAGSIRPAPFERAANEKAGAADGDLAERLRRLRNGGPRANTAS